MTLSTDQLRKFLRPDDGSCPQSGQPAMANTDPTGQFDCVCCGKPVTATPLGRVPKHRMPAPDEAMQSILNRRAEPTLV